MNAINSPSYVLGLTANESLATLLAAMLDDWNLSIHLPRREAETRARLEVYCASREEAKMRHDALTSLLASIPGGKACRLTLRQVKAEHWAESWKKHFHVRRVSNRIIIRPPWESHVAAPEEYVLVMEPGLSFGTGEHETTRACLKILDELQPVHPKATVLDIGCGTGVLAIAAAMLGFPRVTALDYDATAIRITRANAELNGVAGRIDAREADIRTWRPDARYDIVLANLLSGLLTDNVEQMAAVVATGSGSRLVLSGILTSQYAGVKKAYQRQGFHEVRALTLNDWTTSCFWWG